MDTSRLETRASIGADGRDTVLKVAGIDYSTHAIDIVTVDEDGRAIWHHHSAKEDDSFERTRTLAATLPSPAHSLWDDIIAVGIEEPAGQNTRPLNRVQGAILARIPRAILVEPILPSVWRNRIGLSGKASKQEIADFACQSLGATNSPLAILGWTQDAFDAYCIALAVRSAVVMA